MPFAPPATYTEMLLAAMELPPGLAVLFLDIDPVVGSIRHAERSAELPTINVFGPASASPVVLAPLANGLPGMGLRLPFRSALKPVMSADVKFET